MNLDVFQGAVIALVSLGSGTLLGEYLTRRVDKRDRGRQFAQDALLDLQGAIGDLAIAAEQIQGEKRDAGTWVGGERGTGWTDLNKAAVQSIRFSVLVSDEQLQLLIRELEESYRRMASAAAETDAVTEGMRSRELLRQANVRIGNLVRDL